MLIIIMNYKTISNYNSEYAQKSENKLDRFIDAQDKKCGIETVYEQAQSELKNGKKTNHWMWFIFPQLRGLGKSEAAWFYGLDNLMDANNYVWNNSVLGSRFFNCCDILLKNEKNDASSIFGYIDTKKLKSSLTLFSYTWSGHDEYVCEWSHKLLQKYFNGDEDKQTKEKCLM